VIAVTGASGFVGSRLVRRLASLRRPVRALVRSVESTSKEGRLAGLDVDVVEADVTRAETLPKAMAGVSAVVHTVAVAVEKRPGTYEKVNYQGTVNVVEAARASGTRRFINMSQLGASPDLPYPFLASKGRAQAYVAASGLDWTGLRPSVIWGPEDEFANTFARLAPLSPLVYPIVGNGQAPFQPIWVEDVVTCVVRSLDDPTTIGQEYELGGPETLTLEEIERRTFEAIGARRVFVRVPLPIMRGVVTLMETLLPSPPVTRSLLDLLAVPNVTRSNAIHRFVPDPRPFTPGNASYMRQFRLRQTLTQLLGG
jgi:NADH dehydrogenase